MRVLPERIYLHELDPHPPGPEADYRTRWTVPLGIRESDLTVAYNHMHMTPHLLDLRCPEVRQDPHRACGGAGDLRAQQPARRCGSCWPTTGRGCSMPCRRATCSTRARSTATTRRSRRRSRRWPLNLQKRLPPPDLTTVAAAGAVLVDGPGRGPAGRRLAHDRRRERRHPADGAAGAVAARGGRHRAARHRDVPDEPGASGDDGQVRRRRFRRRVADDVPVRGEDRSSRRARSSSSGGLLARRFSSRRTAKR